MNARQRWVLALGVGAIVSVLAFGTSHAPAVGPVVEHVPGQYSRNVTDAILPKWVLFAALGLAALTGATVYWTRTARR